METAIIPTLTVTLNSPPATKWEREEHAFRQLLPALMEQHRGKYAAVHEGQVVEIGVNRLEVAMRTLQRIGNVAIHVGLIDDQPRRVYRSGIVREVRRLRASS